MISFGLILWHINHYRLFNAKSSLYIYIKYIWFGLVGFYGISTIVGYLMPKVRGAYYVQDLFLDFLSPKLVVCIIHKCVLYTDNYNKYGIQKLIFLPFNSVF